MNTIICQKFNDYSKKINWKLFGLICIFTMGSWIDISGIWCELPIMVNTLPEGWRLPAILTVTSQFAQIGPISYFIGKTFFPSRFNRVKTIYAILIVGAVSCMLLSFFWDRTFYVFDQKRSLLLYIFNFTLSFLDGMSTITFLPFIGQHFIKEYIISNYVGESLSSLVPGLLGILQGIKSIKSPNKCNLKFNMNHTSAINQTSKGHSNVDTIDGGDAPRLRFSVSTYFLFMFSLVCISAISFFLINLWNKIQFKRKVSIFTSSLDSKNPITIDAIVYEVSDDGMRSKDSKISFASLTKRKKYKIGVLFFLTFMISFLNYGYLPGLFSYSTMPYGIKFFFLATNISCLFLPLSILLSIWSYNVSLRQIIFETSIPIIGSVYIIALAVLSPCPPLAGTQLGGYIIVAMWVITSCFFMRIRCLISTKLEKYGEHILFSLGCFTILGQVLGGFLVFTQVEIYRQFQELPECSSLARVCGPQYQ